MDAVSADNAWAVGLYGDSSSNPAVKTLVEHWNGKTWTAVSSPDASGYIDSVLQGVSGSAAGNIWSVGVTSNDGGATTRLLYEKWNGHEWVINSAS